MTENVNHVFKELEKCVSENRSPRQLQKEFADLLQLMGARGFLTCLGIRKTVSSQDIELPPDKQQMLCSFNRLFTILSPEELCCTTNPPLLTVGARAI